MSHREVLHRLVMLHRDVKTSNVALCCSEACGIEKYRYVAVKRKVLSRLVALHRGVKKSPVALRCREQLCLVASCVVAVNS